MTDCSGCTSIWPTRVRCNGWHRPDLQAPVQARSLLLSKDTYQQLHTTDDSVYGVISDLLRDIAEVTEETGYLRFAMTERLLVSGRHHALCAVDATRRALEDGHRIESVAALLETIVENVADTMDRHCRAHRAIARRDRGTGAVGRGSRSAPEASAGCAAPACACTGNYRACGLCSIVSSRRTSSDLKPALQLRAGKLAQRLDGLDHTVVEMRERSRLLQEELHLKIEEQGNNNIRVLSVLTAMLMPPTLVTGIFGMNTKGLPFTDLDTAFLWASLLMVLSSFAAYLIMKRIGIIR